MTNADTTARFEAAISNETKAAVANLVDYTIEREYGHGVTAEMNGARTLALAGIRMDWHALYVQTNGDDRHLASAADSQLRVMVEAGLASRRCQCTLHVAPGSHRHVDYRCTGHYEADVPAVGDLRLCGNCYPVYADAAGV